MTPKPTDPRYPQHGFTPRKPYIVSDYVSDEVWEECAKLADDNGYVLFKISDADGEIVVLKEKMSIQDVRSAEVVPSSELISEIRRGSFFALKPGERGKHGTVGEGVVSEDNAQS
jgi:hypothetical protein